MGHGGSEYLHSVNQVWERWSRWGWEVVAPAAEGELDRELAPEVQLALDEVLLSRVAARVHPPTLRFWGWSERCLVLGSNQSIVNEVDSEQASELGFRVVRRMTGGGAMIAEPGRTITYSLYSPAELVEGMSLRESFAFLDAWAVRGLERLGVPASYRPINDIVSPRGKIGGAAQARRRGGVLHHALLAYSMDVQIVPRLIRVGRERRSQLGIRSAEKAVSPLDWFLSLPLGEVVRALIESFASDRRTTPGTLSPAELAEAAALARTKYSTPEWIERLP